MGEAGRPLDHVRDLVDQHRIGGRPARGARAARRARPGDRSLLGRAEQAIGGLPEHRSIGEEPEYHPDRICLGPDRVHSGPDLASPADGLVRPVVAGLASDFHLAEDDVRDPVREHVTAGSVPNAALPQLGDELRDPRCRHPPPACPPRQDDRLGRLADPVPQRRVQHVHQPGVAFEPCRLLSVRASDGHSRDHLGDRCLLGVELAERGQDVADIGQKRPVRAKYQHTTPAHPLPVGVEEISHPV